MNFKQSRPIFRNVWFKNIVAASFFSLVFLFLSDLIVV